MTKKRVFSVLLLIVMLLLMTTGVLAAGSTFDVPTYCNEGLKNFSTDIALAGEPVYASTKNTENAIKAAAKVGSTTRTIDWPKQYACTLTVPSGTSSVTVTFSSVTEDGFFRVYEPDGALDYNAILDGYEKKEDATDVKSTITIHLDENGEGKSAVVFPYDYKAAGGNNSYNCNNNTFFRFIVKTEAPKYSFGTNLPEAKQYYELGKTASALTVNVSVSDGESVAYKWYKGTDAGNIDTLVAEGATYTPDTSATGITYYQVKATVTPVEGDSVEISSRVMTAVVKDPNLKVSLDNYGYSALTKESNRVFSLKTSSNIKAFLVKITGKLPNGITIKNVWSGSPVDQFDLTKQGAVEYNEDLNTFTLDLTAAAVDEAVKNMTWVGGGYSSVYAHVYGRCLYIQTSDDAVYTIVNDSSDGSSGYRSFLPELVQLTDLDGTVLPDFQVSELQSSATTSSVVRGTIGSTAALRAQVKNGGTNPTQNRVNNDPTNRWSEVHQNWIVVNGQKISGSFYGLSEGFSGNSPAFTLQPGLNVVEVYTNVEPIDLVNYKLEERNGLRGSQILKDARGNEYEYANIKTGSVVYLIDYQGETATAPAEDTSNTALGNVIALRYGEETDYIGTCPVCWSEDEKAYVLTVPESFNANGPTSATDVFTHSVLMLAKPAGAGGTVDFTSNAAGLINGEVAANCAFLNIEKLYGQTDPSFTITVTAADGVTTKTYPVKVIYVSSDTKPGITVNGPTLDVPYSNDTYAYYLNYASASSASGTMTVTIPAGATATVNGKSVTSGEKITLDPKEDFYRVTITAADGLNTSSYYFVTKYADGTMPYTTISDKSKALAKEMLSGWYESLRTNNLFSSYWRVYMAKATGNADGSEYDFNGAYVENPATHGMKQATDWAACIMEIVMLGYNPYSFPYGDNPTFDYVNEGLLKCGGGPYANNVWYHMATTAAGAPQTMLSTILPNAVLPTYDLDTRAWIIASLSAVYETKDMLYYVDSLHNVQDTSGTYTSLWTNQSWHSSSSGNRYTIGCVLSAIASSGTDPDRMFAYGDHTPLQTIRDTMYKDGLFYSNGSRDGALPKDMVVGLGDILKGSNVWARYALTEQKYNDLKAKAEALNAQGANITIPGEYEVESTTVGKAYYDLYDDVYAALLAAGRKDEAYAMRPDVHWGMPEEFFADAVSKVDVDTATEEQIKELIDQYEKMDEGSRALIKQATLDKYQRLLKEGLKLKAGSTDTSKVEKIYDEIAKLPAASEITNDNVDEVLKKVSQIEDEIGALTPEEKSLLDWMGESVTKKLEDIRKAAPKQDITVSFTLYGDTHHDIKTDDDIHTYFFDGTSLDKWIETTNVTVPEGSTVLTVFEKVLGEKKFTYNNKEDLNYISSITTDKGLTLAEKNNTDYSGWMYLVNGTYADVGLNAKEVKKGDVIVWHFTDDYRLEHSGMAYTPERVIEYVANLYDVSTPDKANAAYNKISTEYKTQVDALRANRKSVRDVTALIEAITDWNVPMKTANDRTAVTQWVRDKLNKELADKLDGVALDVGIDYYHGVTPATDEADGKYTVEITVSKGSGSLGATSKLKKAGVITKAPSANAGVLSVTVCGTSASASEDGSTYTVTVPYGSTVTADSFTITLSSNAASITADPAETESGVWTFTVTAEDGTTTADYTVKVLVAADPAEGNKAAVDAANAMLEKTSFIYASKDVNTEAAAKAAVERQIGALFGDADIFYEITMTGFTAAEDGTLWSEPTNGSFSFTVKLTKGENDSYAEASASLTGTITAASKPVTPPTPSKPTKPSTKPKDEPAKPDASRFNDVSRNNWYFDSVQYVLENGLMNGTSASEFSPNADTTRGMIVTILARMEGVNTSGGETWYARGREWAMENGISDGTNMEGKITREQLAAMLYRYAKMKGYDVSAPASLSGYTDASSVSGWAKEAMQWAVGSGLIQGSNNALTPQANASRAQIATILMRFAQNIAK